VRWPASARADAARRPGATGFRAPTLSDIFLPLSSTFVGEYDDPLRCPQTGFETDCQANFEGRFGGNPDLKPERSKQINAGLVAEPLEGSPSASTTTACASAT
jgi:iron complex outermembrane receptor protein